MHFFFQTSDKTVKLLIVINKFIAIENDERSEKRLERLIIESKLLKCLMQFYYCTNYNIHNL